MIPEMIFRYLYAVTLCIFGVFFSASICGINLNKRNVLYLMFFIFILLIIQIFFLRIFDATIVRKIYPFIVHIPLIVLLVHGFNVHLLSATCSVVTAFMLCEPSKWCALLMYSIYNETWFYHFSHILFTIIFGAFLIHKLSPRLAIIFSQPTKTVILFAILPFTFYLFDYSFIVYTDIFYTDYQLVHEFLLFVLSITYLILCSLFFKEHIEKTALKHQHQIMQIQSSQIQKEIEMIRRSEHEMAFCAMICGIF